MLPRPPGSTLFPCTTLFRSGKSLAKACSGMNKCPQKLINVRYQSNGGSPLDAPELREAVAATEARLADTGRVLLRLSGTEPVIRVMVEGQNARSEERRVGKECRCRWWAQQ